MDIQKVWNDALKEIKEQISKASFETWFKATKPLSLENNIFFLAVPHAFAADWLTSRYGNMIKEVLRKVTGNPKIEFKATAVYPEKEEQILYADSTLKTDTIEDRLIRIEEKLDKLLELLSKNKTAE